MKTYRAIKIDVDNYRLYETIITDMADVQRHVGNNPEITSVHIRSTDHLIVDKEGLEHNSRRGNFVIFPPPYGSNLFSKNGLIVGLDEDGNFTDTTITTLELEAWILFLAPD